MNLLVVGSFLGAIGISLFTLTGKSQVLSAQSNNTNPTNTSNKDLNNNISLIDISSHSNSKSCWMAINGDVYDVTKYIGEHPGGSRILMGCGKDATKLFQGAGGHIHSRMAEALLRNYKIGTLSG